MHDLQPIRGGISRIIGSGGGGGEWAEERQNRRFPLGQQGSPAVKCPRCESVNTKFCYYNNYNLSQPRHFCKSCRRYWTKGGALRNVPVGGSCRKAKRSAASSSSKTSKRSSAGKDLRWSTINPNPISDPSSHPVGGMMDVPGQVPEMLPDAGGFTSLMAVATNQAFLGFEFSEPPLFRLPVHHHKIGLVGSSVEEEMLDPTVSVSLPPPFQTQVRGGGGGGGGLDWQGSEDPSLFDLTGADQGLYWNQTHWG